MTNSKWECPNCKWVNEPDRITCAHCGTQRDVEK